MGVQKYFFSKEELYELYVNQKKSTRKIASELQIPKTTIELHLKRLGIPLRTKSESMKERMKRDVDRNKNLIKARYDIKNYAEIYRQIHRKRRQNKIQEIEKQQGQSIKDILNKLYLDQKMSIGKIGKFFGFGNRTVSRLLKGNNIQIKPRTWYISSLKGETHPLYGKTWEEIYGEEKAKTRRKSMSIWARESIIERIKNRKFPFFHTKIEEIMFYEMYKRDFFFKFQYRINNFVCDFALPNSKIIVECDGDFWHANPKIYDRNDLGKLSKIQQEKIVRDQRKDEFLKKNGWV